MNEFELIARLTKNLPSNKNVLTGAGDDCAVLDFGLPEKLILFKTDAIVEGVHFTKEIAPEKIGRKALARCLSDIAAMAGTPTAALVTIGLPKNFDAEFVEKIYDGINFCAKNFGVAIVGGETVLNPERIFISIALLGTVPRERGIQSAADLQFAELGKKTRSADCKSAALYRSGAKIGDAIFVTGELGGSLAEKHLEFEPRIAEANWLAENFSVHALIDVSDGLAGDLRHILNASNVGAEILKSAIPISRAAKVAAKKSSLEKPAFFSALTDGEDFELLFTIASKDAVKLLDAWKNKFPKLKLSCIGKIVAGEGILIRDKNSSQKFNGAGYVHFAR